jgi:uncharacterized protein (DUF1697 family)
MTTYVVLLRGINVGRAHRIAMADLRALLTAAGHGDVRTLLQSGNVVLDAGLSATELSRSVEQALEQRFGFPVPVVVRTSEEFLAALEHDPLRDVATDPTRYVVSFAATEVPGELADWLGSVEPGDDAFAVHGRELYLWCPHGQLESPLATALGKFRGGPVGTARNWNTARKVAALLSGR